MQDRRLYPRYTFTRPVELRSPAGEAFAGESCDISVAGVGLLVARSAVLALAQGGSILTTGDELRLMLMAAGDALSAISLGLDCRVKHVRRLSQEQYMVSALFADLSPEQEAALIALVERIAAKEPV